MIKEIWRKIDTLKLCVISEEVREFDNFFDAMSEYVEESDKLFLEGDKIRLETESLTPITDEELNKAILDFSNC